MSVGRGRRVASRVARAAWRALAGRPFALPSALVARYPELARAEWRRGGLPPRIGGWCLGRRTVAGITVGRVVWLADAAALAPALLLHELAHVEQFGSVRTFPVRYVWESVRRGYAQNRFEVEADAFAARILAERPPSGGAPPPSRPAAARGRRADGSASGGLT